MSVYIKGMELPKGDHVRVLVSDEWGNTYQAFLIPPHGRLIDADELANYKFIAIDGHDDGATYRLGWNDAIEAIMEYAPTVIPAEEE